MSTRVDRRIETQRSRLRDGSSAARTALGELTVAVRVLRSAVSSLDAAQRDRLVLRVVRTVREAINEAHEHQRRTTRRRTHTQRSRRSS